MALQKTFPDTPEWLDSSTKNQDFLDEWSAVHFFVGWKMGQLWGFWPAIAAHAFYEIVIDPARHAEKDRAALINSVGDTVVAAMASYWGSKYRR